MSLTCTEGLRDATVVHEDTLMALFHTRWTFQVMTGARTLTKCGGKQSIRGQYENPVMLPFWPYLAHF